MKQKAILFLLISLGLLISAPLALSDVLLFRLPTGHLPKAKLPQVIPTLLRISPDDRCQQWVDSVFNKMTPKERVGQLFIYTIAPVQSKQNMQLLRDAVQTHKVGGLLFSGGKMQTQAQLTNQAQRMAKLPLMITFDGEWGLAMRLRGTPVFPRNMVLGCIQNDSLIYQYGREMARQCKELGVQVNFAPVADVNINPSNPVINSRSFGENPLRVANKVIAYASGLEDGGVLSVSKHFPGHGDTDVDSHKALPILPFTRERLDSVEIYPFKRAIQAGLSGIMVGHLQVPAIEPVVGVPSSLSRKVVYNLLTEELAFKGLIFTDALSMRGVAGNTSVSLQALKAGNDMVLAPRNLKVEIEAVLQAIERGEISKEEINEKCRKVLTYKYTLGLARKPFVQLSGLGTRINTEETRTLIRKLHQAAITVLKNDGRLLPLPIDTTQVALLEVGDPGEADAFIAQLKAYTPLARFQLRKNMEETERQRLLDSLTIYKRIIVSVTDQRLSPYQSFFATFTPTVPTIYTFFTPAKMMLQIQGAVARGAAVVLGHSTNEDVQQRVAAVLFAQATVDGRLSASLGELFCLGDGVTITPETASHFTPQEYGMNADSLQQINHLAQEGVAQGAYPGCQIVVLRQGKTVYNKTFGTRLGNASAPVSPTDIYDLASLSKTTGTLLAVMKLYDKGRFNLSDKLSDYLPYLKKSNKSHITIREVLLHQSGLPAGIVFYPEVIDKDSYKGNLFATRPDVRHALQLGAKTWANPRFAFRKELVSRIPTADYTLAVSDSIWLNRTFLTLVREQLVNLPMKEKVYRYSDVGFILLGELVEKLAEMPLDKFLQGEFYEPMGLKHTLYLPLRRFSKSQIVPSAYDGFLRKATVQGFVHDESAAFLGGVAGNAGLFSTATEVARIYQMLLNGGELDGNRYLSRATCELFTTETARNSRRGLGFDKPDSKDSTKSPCAKSAPASVYGHTGFTGTCAWVDPENELVYVFLSNRTYPDPNNRMLMELDIRSRIQEAIYHSMK